MLAVPRTRSCSSLPFCINRVVIELIEQGKCKVHALKISKGIQVREKLITICWYKYLLDSELTEILRTLCTLKIHQNLLGVRARFECIFAHRELEVLSVVAGGNKVIEKACRAFHVTACNDETRFSRWSDEAPNGFLAHG